MRKIILVLLALVAITAGALALAPESDARSRAQAVRDARYFSADDCPHKGGVCMDRRSGVLDGLGGGKWRIYTEGWECSQAAFYLQLCSARRTTWYYIRECTLLRNGHRTRCSNQRDW